MELAGSCGSRSLKEIYEADRKNIESQVSASAITVGRLQSDAFVLSWRAGDRIHYGKMWSAKGDAGCFVRATFEYGEAERSTFDTIIATVAAADPTCP